MAACVAVVAIVGLGVFKSGLFGKKTDIAGTITTRKFTEKETATLFPKLSVTDRAIFMISDKDDSQELIDFEGNKINEKLTGGRL